MILTEGNEANEGGINLQLHSKVTKAASPQPNRAPDSPTSLVERCLACEADFERVAA